MHIIGWIFTGLISLLGAAVLELNRNTLTGWLLLIIAAAGMIYAGMKPLRSVSWWGRGLSVLGYLALCACIVMITWPPVKQVPASKEKNPEKTETVATQYGDVRGVVLNESVELFAGIPYAAPPVDELRWKEPQDAQPWSGIRECDTFAPMSMQVQNLPIYSSLAQIIGYHDYSVSLDDNYVEAASEDSLYLNIWRPRERTEKAPVVVYIHGGSLQTGQPWYADYSGEGFAKDGVICVNMGYRLGVFGFLASEELAQESPNGTAGNYGLLHRYEYPRYIVSTSPTSR